MKKEQRMTQILLLCYLILLTWIILFKLQLPTDGWIEYRSVNLIPFGASVVIASISVKFSTTFGSSCLLGSTWAC